MSYKYNSCSLQVPTEHLYGLNVVVCCFFVDLCACVVVLVLFVWIFFVCFGLGWFSGVLFVCLFFKEEVGNLNSRALFPVQPPSCCKTQFTYLTALVN